MSSPQPKGRSAQPSAERGIGVRSEAHARDGNPAFPREERLARATTRRSLQDTLPSEASRTRGMCSMSPLSWGIQKVPNPQTQTVEGWEWGWGGERGLGLRDRAPEGRESVPGDGRQQHECTRH